MKNLLIIGARGLGREVYDLACSCQGYESEFIVRGFLDDNVDALKGLNGYPPIISSVENYVPQDGDIFACALGNPIHKKKYVEIILEKGGEFINLIHPSAHIGQNCKHGKGLIMFNNSHIGQDVRLGDFVTFDGQGSVGHDCHIGNYTHIGAQSSVAGFCMIADCVTINPGAHIIPHCQIGENAVIGIGSIVINKVKPNTTVFGNPAKRIDL